MILGMHHVTAIASDAQQNVDFYVGTLGMRLLKRTVNFDDPTVYHLYYGDRTGTPGTVLTHFPYGRIRPGTPGSGTTASTTLAIPTGTLGKWKSRLIEDRVEVREHECFGQTHLRFQDPDGMLFDFGEAEATEHPEAIARIAGVVLQPIPQRGTKQFLTQVQGAVQLAEERGVTRFQLGPATIDVVENETAPMQRSSAGAVHHVALGVDSRATQEEWLEKVRLAGRHPSDVLDRNYFESIHFREPGMILLELATSGPGFDADEPASELGAGLKLPPRYEPMRETREAKLPPLVVPTSDWDL